METTAQIPAREAERMMKLQDMILKALAKKISWIAAAEIAGMSNEKPALCRGLSPSGHHHHTFRFRRRPSKPDISIWR